MTTITVLTEEGAASVEGHWSEGLAIIDPERLPGALGWELKPQGLCRGDVCVIVADHGSIQRGTGIDLGAVAGLLGRPVLTDPDEGVVVVGVAASERRRALVGRELPPLYLPGIDGGTHALDGWRGKKKLLVVFASW